MKKCEITREIELEIVTRYQNGEKVKDIKADLGITDPKQFYNVLSKNGVPLKQPQKAHKQAKVRSGSKIKKCPNCKAIIKVSGARFCYICGADIRSNKEKVAEKLGYILQIISPILPASNSKEITETIRAAIEELRK